MSIRIVAEEPQGEAVDRVRRLKQATVPGMTLSSDTRGSLKKEHNIFIDCRFSPLFDSTFKRLNSF